MKTASSRRSLHFPLVLICALVASCYTQGIGAHPERQNTRVEKAQVEQAHLTNTPDYGRDAFGEILRNYPQARLGIVGPAGAQLLEIAHGTDIGDRLEAGDSVAVYIEQNGLYALAIPEAGHIGLARPEDIRLTLTPAHTAFRRAPVAPIR